MNPTTMTATVELITPKVAATYLENQERNRFVNKSHVARLAADMANGNWMMTGESIKFNGESLIDGQHRLHACIASGQSFVTLVVRGIPADSHKAMDSGLKRTVGDAIRMFGNIEIPNTNVVAAAARLILAIEHRPDNPEGAKDLTHAEMVLEIEANPDLYIAAGRYGRTLKNWGSAASAAALYVLARRAGYSEEMLESYAANLISGAGLPPQHPCLTYRNWIARKPPRSSYRPLALLSAHIKTFDAYAHARSNQKLYVWTGKSPFPTLEPSTRPQP